MNTDLETYKRALEDWEYARKRHGQDIGLIGRFFEKLFGDDGWSRHAWKRICKRYGI